MVIADQGGVVEQSIDEADATTGSANTWFQPPIAVAAGEHDRSLRITPAHHLEACHRLRWSAQRAQRSRYPTAAAVGQNQGKVDIAGQINALLMLPAVHRLT